MSYQNYPPISSTPPPMMTSDTQNTTPYQHIANSSPATNVPMNPNMQMQMPNTSSGYGQSPSYVPSPGYGQSSSYGMPPIYAPPLGYATPPVPIQMSQPSLPMGVSNNTIVEHEELKGWSFINILLVILLICSCLSSIGNFINGEIANGICCILCLCLFYWLYSYYNSHDSMPLSKFPTNYGGININVR